MLGRQGISVSEPQNILLKGDVLSQKGLLKNHFLLCEKGLIRYISPKKPRIKKTTGFFDLRKLLILPGFIDLHLHGDSLLCARHFSRFGTTGFLSTIPAISKTDLVKRIERINGLVLKDELHSKILGVHLEGPYLNKKMAGAQNRNFIRKIDLDEAKGIIKISNGLIKIVSLAPELDNSKPLINLLVKNKIVASFGHTDAEFKEAVNAIEKGMRFSTHTFNRMGTLHHRMPGVLGAVLSDDRVFCEIILDNLHLNPVLFKILLRCKGISRIILSSDSVKFEDSIPPPREPRLSRRGGMEQAVLAKREADGTPPFWVGGSIKAAQAGSLYPVRNPTACPVTNSTPRYGICNGAWDAISNGVYRLKNGRIAGSNLTLNIAIRNAIRYGNLSLKDAVSLATINPARLLGIDDRKGSLETGKDADIVVTDENLNVVMTICEGRIVYKNKVKV